MRAAAAAAADTEVPRLAAALGAAGGSEFAKVAWGGDVTAAAAAAGALVWPDADPDLVPEDGRMISRYVAVSWRGGGELRLLRPLTSPGARAGQAMGLPPAFHAAAAAEPWAAGAEVRIELYTHLLNKRSEGWHSLALFPAVDDGVGRMQDFDGDGLVDLLARRGWAGALSCNPPYVEGVFDRDLPKVAAA
eukprot:gene3988-52180_t